MLEILARAPSDHRLASRSIPAPQGVSCGNKGNSVAEVEQAPESIVLVNRTWLCCEMSRPNLALFACLVVLLALATPSHSEERELELEAFEAIKSCLPLNVLVAPTDDGPKLKVDAEEGVVGAVQAEVLDGVLVLSLSETIRTEAPAKVTVSAPKEGLVMVVNTGSGKLVLGPGFRGEALELSNDGKGELVAVDVEVPGLTVTNNG